MMQFSNDNFWQKSLVNGVKWNESKSSDPMKIKQFCFLGGCLLCDLPSGENAIIIKRLKFE